MSRWTWVGVGLLGMFLGCSGEPEPQPEPAAPVKAGEGFRVKFETTKGDFVIKVRPEWAPEGAKRFRELVESGFYDGVKFFRVVPGFMAQFGISGDPEVSREWQDKVIPDDLFLWLPINDQFAGDEDVDDHDHDDADLFR